MPTERFVSDYSNILIDVLRNVSEKGSKNYRSYDFDCNILSAMGARVIDESVEHSNCRKCLEPLEGPVLYWFEVLSETDAETIRNKLWEYKSLDSAYKKATPSMRNKLDKTSKILYVGKVKRKFWSRVNQHIGIYNNRKTQGLQLIHWSNGLDLKLRLHAFEFEEGMSNLVSIFEWKFSKELRPILGMH